MGRRRAGSQVGESRTPPYLSAHYLFSEGGMTQRAGRRGLALIEVVIAIVIAAMLCAVLAAALMA
jgi:hypothetical protein